MRRHKKPNEYEKLNARLVELYHEYRVYCREAREFCMLNGLPENGAKYHSLVENEWNAKYDPEINSIHSKLDEMRKRGA